MKVKINSLPPGYSVVGGKVVNTKATGGATTGDQSNYGLVTTPTFDYTSNIGQGGFTPSSEINNSLKPIPREEANLEAEKGETVLTDLNNDGNFELYNILGNRHTSGGTPLSLPPQSFIFSDTALMKLDKYELAEMNIDSKKKITPAKVSKNYPLNKYTGVLDNPHSDKISRDTAEYMLDKNKKSLSQLAFLQEAKKEFDDGVPLAAYPYLTERGINPMEFSQQVQDISAQEAEQQMMMQLPIEQREQLMKLKAMMAQINQQKTIENEQQNQALGMPTPQQPNMIGVDPNAAPPQGPPPMGGGMPPMGGGMPGPQGPPQGPPQAAPQPAAASYRYGGAIPLPKMQGGGDMQKGNMYQVAKLNEAGHDVTYDEFTNREKNADFWEDIRGWIGKQVTVPNYKHSQRGNISFNFTEEHYRQLKQYYNDVTSWGLHNSNIQYTDDKRSYWHPLMGYYIYKDNPIPGLINELSHGYDWGRSPLPMAMEAFESVLPWQTEGYDSGSDVHGEGAHAYGPVEARFYSQFAKDNPSYTGLPKRSVGKRISDFFDFNQIFSGKVDEPHPYDPSMQYFDQQSAGSSSGGGGLWSGLAGINKGLAAMMGFDVEGKVEGKYDHLSFNDAFKNAEVDGQKLFSWRGKEYVVEHKPVKEDTGYNYQTDDEGQYIPQSMQRYGGSLPKAQSKGEIDLNLLNVGDCTGGGCKDTGDTTTGLSLFTGLEGTNEENALIQAGLKGNIGGRSSSNIGFNLSGEGGYQTNLKDLLNSNVNAVPFFGGKLNVGYKDRPLYMGYNQYPGTNVGVFGQYDSGTGLSAGVEGGFGPLNLQGGYNFDTKSPFFGGKLTFNLQDGGSFQDGDETGETINFSDDRSREIERGKNANLRYDGLDMETMKKYLGYIKRARNMRDGERMNEDGSVSTVLLRHEELRNKDGSSRWVVFPTLFQEEDGTWLDYTQEAEQNWESVYEFAKERGEVFDFGDDANMAAEFAKGNWKQHEPIKHKTNIEKLKDFGSKIYEKMGESLYDSSGRIYNPSSTRKERYGGTIPKAQYNWTGSNLPQFQSTVNVARQDETGGLGPSLNAIPNNLDLSKINWETSMQSPFVEYNKNVNQILENLSTQTSEINKYANLNMPFTGGNTPPGFGPAGLPNYGNLSSAMNEDIIAVWVEHIEKGGSPPYTPTPEYTEAYKRVYGDDAVAPIFNLDSDENTPTGPPAPGWASRSNVNPYESQQDPGNTRTYVNMPAPTSAPTADQTFGFQAQGLPLDPVNPMNPYYIGSKFTDDNILDNIGSVGARARSGIELPRAQFDDLSLVQDNSLAVDTNRQNQITVPGYNTETGEIDYSKKEYIPGHYYPELVNEYNTKGIYTDPNYMANAGTIDASTSEKQIQAMQLNNPIGSIFAGGKAIYDQFSGSDEETDITKKDDVAPVRYGGSLPKAQYSFPDQPQFPMTLPNGTVIKNRRQLRKLKNALGEDQFNALMAQKSITENTYDPTKIPTRTSTQETTETTNYTGYDDWSSFYMSDDNIEGRANRYGAYQKRRDHIGKNQMTEQDYHNYYSEFQKVNDLFNTQLSQEERNHPNWDSHYEWEECVEGTTGCKKKSNGKYYKQKIGEDGKAIQHEESNWMFNKTLTDLGYQIPEGMEWNEENINHMQSGFIGGKALELSGEEGSTYDYTGLDDDTWNNLPITTEDGWWGNTMNDQREAMYTKETTPAQDCANAAEIQAACEEQGGTFVPWDPEAKTGCTCTEPIEPIETPDQPDPEFWIQDEMGLANAMDAKFSLKKYYPWAPKYEENLIEPVFKDPTREIAAIGEQANIVTDAAAKFSGPQRSMAVALKAQGEAGKQIADAVNKVSDANIDIANNVNAKNAEIKYKTQVLNNNELKQLYDNTVLTEQNYDNALRKANEQITKQLQNAYTNMANTYNLNSLYPNFNIHPEHAGMIHITNPQAFYSDPALANKEDRLANYINTIDRLDEAGIDVSNMKPTMNDIYPQSSGQTSGQQNANVITGGWQGNARHGLESRVKRRSNLLKKGAQLRKFFLPFEK